MRYMMLIFETDADRKAMDVPNTLQNPFGGAWRAYHKSLVDAGVYVTGHALQPSSTAATVRVDDGRRRVQDGPFADTKEQLGGYIIVEVPSLHQALEWAARCPAATYGTIEVRPVVA